MCKLLEASGLALTISLFAVSSPASDGVLEINQTCAVETGCFSGDAAGLPVTIVAPGSYQLSGNLVVPNANTDGILVDADDVRIDLAGFEIRGRALCSGSPTVCLPSSGSGSGVRSSISLSGTSVANGSIRGMGFDGILFGARAVVTHVQVGSNATYGIATGIGSKISDNTVYQNGETGIVTGAGSVISGNAAYQNGTNGIEGSSGSIVQGNVVRSNESLGLLLGSQSGYRENVITSNGGTVAGGVNAGDNV